MHANTCVNTFGNRHGYDFGRSRPILRRESFFFFVLLWVVSTDSHGGSCQKTTDCHPDWWWWMGGRERLRRKLFRQHTHVKYCIRRIIIRINECGADGRCARFSPTAARKICIYYILFIYIVPGSGAPRASSVAMYWPRTIVAVRLVWVAL